MSNIIQKIKIKHKLILVFTTIIIFILIISLNDLISINKRIKEYNKINYCTELYTSFINLENMFNHNRLCFIEAKYSDFINIKPVYENFEKNSSNISIFIDEINSTLNKLKNDSYDSENIFISDVFNKSANCYTYQSLIIIPSFQKLIDLKKEIDDLNKLNDTSLYQVKYEAYMQDLNTLYENVNEKGDMVNSEIDNILTLLLTHKNTLKTVQSENKKSNTIIIYILLITVFLISFIMAVSSVNLISKRLGVIKQYLKDISLGNFPEIKKSKIVDEISELNDSVIIINENLKNTHDFAISVGKGNLDSKISIFNEKGQLGKALLEMRDSLQSVTIEREKQELEEKKRIWSTEGFAIFGETLRQNNDNVELLSFNIIKKLVQFMQINQGGIFLLDDNDNCLNLIACYAYDRKKYADKKINIGEGLVGTCFLEKETIYLTDVPSEYINITSGLGDATPRSILIVPLKINEEIYGIIELASFNIFEQYQILFIEKICESIASTISSVKINIKTTMLLKRSQEQTEILLQQEEEMRQNMEELKSSQEQLLIRESEISAIVSSIDNTIAKAELSINGTIINLNAKFEKVFEIQNRDGVYVNIMNYVSEVSTDIVDKAFKTASIGNSSDFTIKCLTVGKKEKWLLSSMTPVVDTNNLVEKILFMATDITQQKLFEIELANKDEIQKAEIQNLITDNNNKLDELHSVQDQIMNREAEFSAIIQGINKSLGTYEFNNDAIILSVNQNFIDLTGLTENELVGKSIINFIPKEMGKIMDDLLINLFNGEPHSGAHQFFFNNNEKWFYESYTPVISKDGKCNKILALTFDITNSVFQERNLKQQTENLINTEEELKQNLEELHTMQEKIINDATEQKNRDAILIKEAKQEAQFHILNMEEEFFLKQKELKKKLKAVTIELDNLKNQ